MSSPSSSCKRSALATLITAATLGLPLTGWAQDNADPITLKEVEVTGERVEDPTAPVSGYRADTALSATKTATAIEDTAQSISVITTDRIDDLGAETVQETLRYSAGVGAETFGLDSRGDWSRIRGFDPVIFLDGLQKTFGFYQSPRTEPFTLERIEILRGPASTLYGQGSAGGLINLVTKRPLEEQRTHLEIQVGNHDRKQLNIDTSGPLTDDGSLLYRLVAVGRDSDTQVNFVEDNRTVLTPSLTWRPNDQLEWTLIGNFQEDRTGSTTQFLPIEGTLKPAPHGLPRIPIDVFISEPGFDQYQTRERSGTSLLAFAVNDDLTLRQNLRYSQTEVDYRTMYGQFPPTLQPNGDLPRVAYANKPELDALTMDNQAELLLGSGNIRHRVLAGVDYQHAVSQARSAFNGNAGAINVYNPVYGGFTGFSPADFNEGPENTVSQLGVYLQDEVTIAERWVTTLGIRRDETENRTEGRADQEDDAVTGRAALLYNADNGLSPYISYSESFQPVIGTNVFGESFKPLEGEQIEVGLKYQPPGSNSLYTAAIYDLRQKNVRAPDPNNPQNQIQTGEARSRGIELEALAEISPSWDVIAAYTYTDTEVLEGVNEGNHLASVPEQTASLWSQHDLTIAGLPGLRAGAGVRYVGDNYGGVDTLKTPGVTLFDAMLGYAVGRWDFRLNVNNIEDETYFTTCLTRGDCFVGTKRTVIGTVAVTF